MSRAPDVVDRAIKEIESEARRLRTEIEKQRKELEARVKPLQRQLSDLEEALRRLTRRDSPKPAARRRATARRAPRGANKQAILRELKKRPGASASEVAAATGIKSTVVTASLANLAKQGEVRRSKRKGRVTWKSAA